MPAPRVDLQKNPPPTSKASRKPAGLIPDAPLERAKFFAVVGAFVITIAGLVFSAWWSGVFTRRPVAKVLDTPGWRLANDLNKKLGEKFEFRDVGLSVATEQPLRFKVFGGVYAPEDVARLKEFLKTIRPEEDYDVDIEVLNSTPPDSGGGG